MFDPLFNPVGQFLRRLGKHLVSRGDLYFFDGIHPALGIQLKDRNGVDLIPPEFQTDRSGAVGREQVHNPATHRKLGNAVHLIAADVSRAKKNAHNRIQSNLLPRLERHAAADQFLWRDGVLKKGVDTAADYPAFLAYDAGKHIEPLMLVFMRHPFNAAEDKILRRIKKRRFLHQHGVNVLTKAPRSQFVRGHDQAGSLLFRDCGDQVCFVHGGKADHHDRKCALLQRLTDPDERIILF